MSGWRTRARKASGRRCLFPGVLFVCLSFGLKTSAVFGAENWLTAGAFLNELEKPCVAIVKERPLREVLRNLSTQLKLAIVLDRRVDPMGLVTISPAEGEVEAKTLRETLESVAEQADLGLSMTGDTVYLGPPATARLLRTVAEIRRTELSELPVKRRADLARTRIVSWNDLDAAGEVFARLARGAGLKVLNPDAIPEDLLWGQAFGNASAAEALSVFLAQFDRAFEWQQEGTAIRIIPFPEKAEFPKSHDVPREKRDEILRRIQSTWPEVVVTEEARGLRFAGLAEQHQAVVEWIRPPATGGPRIKPKGDLSRKRLTLRVVQTAARDVLKNLEVTGLSFKVGEGVDLETRLTFELKDAPIDRVVEEIARQLMAEASMEGAVVRLRTK